MGRSNVFCKPSLVWGIHGKRSGETETPTQIKRNISRETTTLGYLEENT